jgi:hypothetical protein
VFTGSAPGSRGRPLGQGLEDLGKGSLRDCRYLIYRYTDIYRAGAAILMSIHLVPQTLYFAWARMPNVVNLASNYAKCTHDALQAQQQRE